MSVRDKRDKMLLIIDAIYITPQKLKLDKIIISTAFSSW